MANAQNVSLGRTYLKRMYDALNRSYSFEDFLKGLRLNAYNEAIDEEYFEDWLDSLGFKVGISQTMSNRPHDLLIEKLRNSFSGNREWVPSRKTIDSFFLDSSNYSPTYYDMAKVALVETTKVVKATGEVIGTVGNVLKAGGDTLANALSGLKYIAYIGGPLLIGYIIYMNKDKIADEAGKLAGEGYKSLRKKIKG